MDRIGDNRDEMWDEEDGFFYDLLRLPNGQSMRLKVRSLAGLLPLCASTVLEGDAERRYPKLMEMVAQFRKRYPRAGRPDSAHRRRVHRPERPPAAPPSSIRRSCAACFATCSTRTSSSAPTASGRFRSTTWTTPSGSAVGHQEFTVQYLPAESNNGMFGGNSNWRGPVWMPVNALIIRALLNLYAFYGNEFTVECPTGSGRHMNLFQVAAEITQRLAGTFRREDGHRPVYGGSQKFQDDPHWRDLILFYEYFHGDNGAGLGASHQTGWAGLVATLVDLFGRIDAKSVLESERALLQARVVREQVGGETVTVGEG
jgi:hypothetical protein